jgi:hypothetical protein
MSHKRAKFNQGTLTTRQLKNPVKYVGKLTEQIVFRSSWEYSFIKYLDNNDNIIEWSSEEISIHYKSIDGKLHRYFPDFFTSYRNENGKMVTALIEIKPYAETQEPKIPLNTKRTRKSILKQLETYKINQLKWQAAKKYCFEKGWKFYVLTEVDISLVPEQSIRDQLKATHNL